MSLTTVESGNVVEQWEEDFHVEFIRDNLFKRFMGRGPNSIIQMNGKLEGLPGTKITFSLVTKLTDDPVVDDDMLEGNEEAGDNYSHEVTAHQYRKAVLVAKHEQKKTHIDLLSAYKEQLQLWARSYIRDLIIQAQLSANIDGHTAYADDVAANRNTWLTNNSDRVLAGAAKSNTSSNVLATALGLVDGSTDTLSPDMLDIAYRMARQASPAIRPYVAKEDEEWYVFFAETWGFRDFKNHSTIQQANRDGWTRGEDNPLFRPGDLQWNGMLVREIPEYDVIADAGDSSIDVGHSVLAGAQDVLIGWADKTHAIDDDFDYKNRRGVGVALTLGVEKASYNGIQHGQVSVFHASEADA